MSEGKWRVVMGNPSSFHIYEDDRPVADCRSEDDARRIVEAMNREEYLPEETLQAWSDEVKKKFMPEEAKQALRDINE